MIRFWNQRAAHRLGATMLIFLLSLSALVTALLSGVFGMAGGMVLMGVYTALLPVPTAMVLHGATQMMSNGSRVWLLRHDIYFRGVVHYCVGALLAFGLLFSLHYMPEPLVVFLGLGLAPFVAPLLPKAVMDFERPSAAVVTGFNVVAVQLMAGAAGPLLDVAFLDTRLTRKQVVATKAVTQIFSHCLKLAYFIPALDAGLITPQLALALLIATMCGTRLGTYVLERMSDAAFRRYSRAIVYAVGAVYLCRAGAVWLS